MRLGDATKTNVSVISTGSLAIDLALGAGGLPCGRIVEIYGPEASENHFLPQCNRRSPTQWWQCCVRDVEHALDPRYAKTVGVQLDNLWYLTRERGRCPEHNRDFDPVGAIDVIVLDSSPH